MEMSRVSKIFIALKKGISTQVTYEATEYAQC